MRHAHERFDSLPNTVVSASLSPVALDPAAIGLAQTSRFTADLRFEVDYGGPLFLEPTLYWAAPVLRQGEALYRYPNPATSELTQQGAFVRVEADLAPGEWIAPSGHPAPDLSAGAPPVRLGLLFQSDVVVAVGGQAEVRIGIDNFRLGSVGEDDLPVISLVALLRDDDYVVLAPAECYDGKYDPIDEDGRYAHSWTALRWRQKSIRSGRAASTVRFPTWWHRTWPILSA